MGGGLYSFRCQRLGEVMMGFWAEAFQSAVVCGLESYHDIPQNCKKLPKPKTPYYLNLYQPL